MENTTTSKHCSTILSLLFFFRNIHFLCVVLYMSYKLLCRLVKLYLLWWEFSTLLTPPITLLHQNGGIPTVWSPSQSHVVAFTADKCACPAPWRCCKSAVSYQGRWLSTAAQPRHEKTRVACKCSAPLLFSFLNHYPYRVDDSSVVVQSALVFLRLWNKLSQTWIWN